ncbi:hypothetical protein GTO10_01115 [Candidatus Saccharibacteria bacterium]|nr:hypothetical protein [Candidatus Saccharibacteria bacterium]
MKSIFLHPAALAVTVLLSIWLWSVGGEPIGWGMTTNFCAVAFTYWSFLILLWPVLGFLNLEVKVPKIFFFAGALFLAYLGTYTLLTYRPFFSAPTIVHVAEAVFGYGFLAEQLIFRAK